ncbi:MAG: hypothetical protein RLZZ533_922, partial [Cyanobacteriota bacterium]
MTLTLPSVSPPAAPLQPQGWLRYL